MRLPVTTRRSVWLWLCLTVAACSGEPTTPPPPPVTPTLGQRARNHLNEVLGVMQANSISRLTLDWTEVRSSVFTTAGAAQTLEQLSPAITVALARLGDGHSSYRAVTGTLFVPTRTCAETVSLATPTLPARIGYIRVGGFSGTSAQASAFAVAIHDAIRVADRDDLIGWIVDLRRNGGGNMWPMIAGLGPILGAGDLGYFIGPDSVASGAWAYRDGASWLGTTRLQSVATPYTLRAPNPKVAVLVDNAVASSGEATFIAFRGRPKTRSFGTATCGLSTANQSFMMNNGDLLNLTVSTMADRTRRWYGGQVEPDEVITDAFQVVARAVTWLESPTPD